MTLINKTLSQESAVVSANGTSQKAAVVSANNEPQKPAIALENKVTQRQAAVLTNKVSQKPVIVETIDGRQKQFEGLFNNITNIIQNPSKIFEDIKNNVNISTKIEISLLSSTLFLAIYGAVIGSGNPLQALSAAIKLPLVMLGGVMACILTLYILDLSLGSERSFFQTLAVVLTAVNALALLLFSFAPITIAFRLTAGGYQFFKILNVLFFAVAAIIGVTYLKKGLNATIIAEKQNKFSNYLYNFWIFLFVLISSQLAWGIRPFFYTPNPNGFELFVPNGGNVIIEIIPALGELLGFSILR